MEWPIMISESCVINMLRSVRSQVFFLLVTTICWLGRGVLLLILGQHVLHTSHTLD